MDMGYLQITIYLFMAGCAGLVIGYFLKQLLAGKAAEQLETMWSEKVRRASRELETLRNDLKSQTQRTEDIERMVDAEADRVKAAREEVAAEKERTARLSSEIAGKQAKISSLEGAIAEWKTKLDAAVGQAASFESVVREKSEALGNLTSDLEKARADSNAKELNAQSLTARVDELAPVSGKLAAALKAIDGWELKYKTLESAKNNEVSALKSRIGVLEPLTAKVKEWEARYNGMLKEKDSSLAKLTASVAVLEPFKTKVEAAAKVAAGQEALIQNLRARAADSEPLEHRLRAADEEIAKLRSQFERAAVAAAERDALVENLRARAADAEPLERRLRAADEETGKLKSQLEQAAVAAAEHNALVENLRARAADAEPLERRLHAADEKTGTLRLRVAELEQSLKNSAVTSAEHEAFVENLRARAADAEPLERRLHAADEELVTLRLQVAALEHSSVNTAVQQEALIQNLRARAADAEPFERRLHNSTDIELRDRLSQSEHRFSQTVDEKDGMIALLKAAVAEKTAEIERLQNPKIGASDDLKKIRGIGPVLEKRLKEYGVLWFKQIALWSKQDILTFEKHFPKLQNRAENDQWVARAKEEHLKKYNEQL